MYKAEAKKAQKTPVFRANITRSITRKKSQKSQQIQGFAGYYQAQKRNDRYHTTALNMKTKKRTRSKPEDFRVRFLFHKPIITLIVYHIICDIAILQFHGNPLR